MLLLLVLLILLTGCFGGYGYAYDRYQVGHSGISLAGVLVVVLIVMLLTGRI